MFVVVVVVVDGSGGTDMGCLVPCYLFSPDVLGVGAALGEQQPHNSCTLRRMMSGAQMRCRLEHVYTAHETTTATQLRLSSVPIQPPEIPKP